jgi:hypothetical protein
MEPGRGVSVIPIVKLTLMTFIRYRIFLLLNSPFSTFSVKLLYTILFLPRGL